MLVLKELIARMGGIEIIEDMSEAQLEAQAGGETLRIEVSTSRGEETEEGGGRENREQINNG